MPVCYRVVPIELVQCKTIDLKVPANAEIVLEGYVSLDEYLPEGPFGTIRVIIMMLKLFPVFKIHAITMRKKSSLKALIQVNPPDEPSVLGESIK